MVQWLTNVHCFRGKKNRKMNIMVMAWFLSRQREVVKERCGGAAHQMEEDDKGFMVHGAAVTTLALGYRLCVGLGKGIVVWQEEKEFEKYGTQAAPLTFGLNERVVSLIMQCVCFVSIIVFFLL